ncbi:MAG: hypothetical protein NWR87_07675, partial [Rhodospirillales bacterium]|nr:hypothetical protein [Rhodospirillales bacterium]
MKFYLTRAIKHSSLGTRMLKRAFQQFPDFREIITPFTGPSLGRAGKSTRTAGYKAQRNSINNHR